MELLIIDGYVDEPGCLGVPPYISPYPRYIYGAAHLSGRFSNIVYVTIDQLRQRVQEFVSRRYDWVIFISGVSVPGNYIGGTPIKFSELRNYAPMFNHAFKILCGPATRFGIGQEGGKPSIPVCTLGPLFDLVITGDAEIVIEKLLNEQFPLALENRQWLDEIASILRPDMESIAEFAIAGAALILQHPNFDVIYGGNMVCEIETFRGCPRYASGGCSFCVEPAKGKPVHRTVQAIVGEVTELYRLGARNFRLGNQTDFYAFQYGAYDNLRYPRPNPAAIHELLGSIRNNCPELKTLHIDNVNALNFALYPEEAREITRCITDTCTAGNVAAIGVESVDPDVIARNNLKCSPDEILAAIKIINEIGAEIGPNGNPRFLPGLNFIMGLPGETKNTLDANMAFLKSILDEGLLIRRVNLRKLMTPASKLASQDIDSRAFARQVRKNEKFYFSWKNQVREFFDLPMLRKVFPFGQILKGAYAEQYEGNSTLLRQPGTYPILCYIPRKLELQHEYQLIIVDHGYRSITCLESPLELIKLGLKELESIPGIGKKRAAAIVAKRPGSRADWLQIIDQTLFNELLRLQPDI